MQRKILDTLEKVLRKSGLTDHQICMALRAFHIFFPNLAAFFIFFGSKRMFKVTLLFNVVIFVLFNCFNGCILSKLERRFVRMILLLWTLFYIILIFLQQMKTELSIQNILLLHALLVLELFIISGLFIDGENKQEIEFSKDEKGKNT